MLKKLNLKRADKYDERVTTYHTIEAVIAHLDGRPHCKRIGNEQGDVPEWDDIVLHDLNGKTIYCQVKRQMTPFCNRDYGDRTIKQGQNKGKEHKLSPLDSAFASLANIFNITDVEVLDKSFHLSTPSPQISVKKDITLAILKDVCIEWKKSGARLEDFVGTKDKHTGLVKTWLKTWCNFQSDEAIFNCLRCVEINHLGDEEQINSLCNMALSNWYQDVDTVRELITQFLVDNASSNHSVTPRLVANHIRNYIKRERPSWVRYEKQGAFNWNISGTLSGETSTIEPANTVVKTLWDDKANRSFELQLYQHVNDVRPCFLDLSLIRLALHSPSSVVLRHNEALTWKASISNAIHCSLGSTKEDLRRLKVFNSEQQSGISESRQLSRNCEVKKEKDLLHESMDFITWCRVKETVDEIISEMAEGEVQDAAEDIWLNWKATIGSDLKIQSETMCDMLHAIVENNQLIGQLRAGLNTVNILSEAFETLLFIAIGLEADSMSWTEFQSKFSLRTIALAVWCGAQPTGNTNRARNFFTDDNLDDRRTLLGKETSRILVLPQAYSSPSEVLGCSLAGDPNSGDRIADARTPKIVITRSMAFNAAIDENTIESLKNYVGSVINKRQEQRDEHIHVLTTGY
ncbi:hypothetical protein CRN32_12410 [Vibrio vulnificus]|uniref:ABC-three component system protein n=1 Tax=Vibrio TaxID=662 RepID=UPI000893C166|nr:MULTISPECIES: ABC-three component system protein [Vibrio]ELA9535178.1 hypothetical protein [Vibrio parahaemolyticus]EHU4848715.1 hypothetical protein [Vibrio vulnificus]EJE8736588.1 hypothetical protein [Vibrio vulnificus]EKA7351129.1 hypothetical protein [Vibrio vulnificus]MBM4843255.1 hypothetical protein [Vibrio parahaemolyticus]